MDCGSAVDGSELKVLLFTAVKVVKCMGFCTIHGCKGLRAA
jgi:hypothetical protein